MISSMTGYGRAEVSRNGIAVCAEVRSVNNRFLEVAVKLPRSMSLRESEVRELVRVKLVRGKITIMITMTQEKGGEPPLRINASAARAYYKLLDELRRSVRIQGKISLDHLLKFSDVLETDGFERGDEEEWSVVEDALKQALDETARMRRQEGSELMNDLSARIEAIDRKVREIEHIALERVPQERVRFTQRIEELVRDKSILDAQRLELELALLADKLDVTEECVRFHSHNKYFGDAMKHEEAAGRKLNFLIQEMNREANTIGAKSNSAEISHIVVSVKEELEKIREQLQNIE